VGIVLGLATGDMSVSSVGLAIGGMLVSFGRFWLQV
jgi:hypothetical protein